MNITESQFKDMIHKIFYDLLNDKNFDLLKQFYAEDAVSYDGTQKFIGREALKKNIIERSKAVPDFKYVVDDIIIQENKAAIRWHATGKAILNFGGFKAGETTNYWGLSICEIKDGIMIKNWETSSVADAPFQE
jgi:predicted ester cyclase